MDLEQGWKHFDLAELAMRELCLLPAVDSVSAYNPLWHLVVVFCEANLVTTSAAWERLMCLYWVWSSLIGSIFFPAVEAIR